MVTKMTNQKVDKTKEFLDNQRDQLKNTTSAISESTTNKVNDNINEYQQINKEIIQKNIDLANKYQQQITNTLKTIGDNYSEAQKNFLYNYQPILSKFLDNAYNKSYWNNFFRFPTRYTETYDKTNQNITDHTINCTQRLNDFALASTENFNKSIEIAQKYYIESVQNYFDFVNKIGRSYNYSQ
jgi:hypothetical protein